MLCTLIIYGHKLEYQTVNEICNSCEPLMSVLSSITSKLESKQTLPRITLFLKDKDDQK